MDQDETTILEYEKSEVNKVAQLVTRRAGLTAMKPKLDAPPPEQPGSVDWTVTKMFGSVEKGLQMIESLVAGQGDQANERWIRFCLLYREWEARYRAGLLLSKPTLNQVCHSLNFPSDVFLGELQRGITQQMSKMGRLQAALKIPEMVEIVVQRVLSGEGDTKDNELGLKLAGMLEDKAGVQVNVQQNNNNSVTLKGELERMKSPLLQFGETVEAIDENVRDGQIMEGELVNES